MKRKPSGLELTGAAIAAEVWATHPWRPRFWLGGNLRAWTRLLVRNRFAVGWRHLHLLPQAAVGAVAQTLLGAMQELVHGRRIDRTRVDAPLFVLGHWRSGTTWLHELLACDPRHTAPTTYECFAPGHFLLTEEFARRWFRWLLPSVRPMDAIPLTLESAQEDEIALCNLGLPSPYATIAFPNRPPQDQAYLDMVGVGPVARERWKRALVHFLKTVALARPGRRLVLKSPAHTCRIEVLLECFPDARFVHIVRDPYEVFASTVNMWKAVYRRHGLQTPTYVGLESHVLGTFVRVHEGLERGRALVPPERFHELRYEDLVRDPLGQMRRLYERLSLGELDPALPALEAYLARTAGLPTGGYGPVGPAWRAEITRRWGPLARRHGYAIDAPG